LKWEMLPESRILSGSILIGQQVKMWSAFGPREPGLHRNSLQSSIEKKTEPFVLVRFYCKYCTTFLVSIYVQYSTRGRPLVSNFVLSQILIGIAICSDILSFQFKERKKIVACLIVSAIFISGHFMLLEHWTAAFLGLLAAARFTTCLFTSSKRMMGCFIFITFVISTFSFEGLLTVLGCAATVFTTVASFSKKDKLLRQLMLVGTMIWITHNYLAGSPGAVLMEALFISSNLVGYFRYYISPKKLVLHP